MWKSGRKSNEDQPQDFTEDEGEEDQEDEEENQKRYEFRKRKTVVLYQAPQVEPRNHRKQNLFYNGPASPARRRYQFNSAAPRSPYSSKRKNRRRHAIHNSDSTSSSSSASDDEDSFERRRVKSKNGAMNRCLPLNLRKEDLLGLHKDRMKIGASLADVDPMQIDSSVCFDSIGGLSSHILALKEMVVFPLLYPEVFEKFKIQPPRGCLFYGPPGTGKTLVARALANECSQGDRKVAFFMRKGADCLSKWVGESERQLRLLFDQAYQMRPSIIFFDEIDGLAPVRSSRQDQIHSSIVSTLLALMDGLDSRGEVVVIGATNRLDSIDPALRRPGRFDREFLFGLPDRDTRKDILRIHTRQWNPKPSDGFLEELADKCVGYCGADIKSVCAEAALCALRRHYPQIYATTEKLQLNVDSIQINSRDFMVAMQKTVPASQRAVSSPGKALSPIVKPLLENTLQDILVALIRVFPHAEQAIKRHKSSDRLIRHRACALKDTTHAIIKEELDEEFEKICEGIQESRQKRGCPDSKFAPSYYKVQSKQTTAVDLRKSDADVPKEAKPKVPAKPMAATVLKKQRRRCRWSCGIIAKKRKLSQTPKGDQSVMEEEDDAAKEIEEGEDGLENTSESSLDQTDVEICGDPEQLGLIERGQADGAVPQTRDNTPGGTQTLLPEPATKKKVAAAPAEKPTGAVSNGVVSETEETWSDNDKEGNEVPLLRATRSSRSKLEQQQFINVKKALEILSAPTPDVLVDHDKLKGLLTKVIAKTDGYAVYQLEKLYAVICQCIYNHRKDYDKTALIQEMQKEIDNFIS
ncbi:UNVERIFIED_CONTAM: hypothetical protein FKN15_055258 [Acipenser sinensis]